MQQSLPRALLIHPGDNVAVALSPIEAGERIAFASTEVAAAEPIPFAHKISICSIRSGEPIVKYGAAVGFATCDIPAGNRVHHHNMKSYFVAKREEQPR
jgi:altronate hydrolase